MNMPQCYIIHIYRLSCLLQLESVNKKNYLVLHHTTFAIQLLGKNIFLISLFSNTFNQCSVLTVRDKIPHHTQ